MPRLPGEYEKGEQIGEGAEKRVFRDKNNPARVLKVMKGTAPEWIREISHSPELFTKGYFYLTDIAHIFCPNLIPKVHAVFFDTEGNAVTSEQLVSHSEQYKKHIDYYPGRVFFSVDKSKDAEIMDEIRKNAEYKKILDIGLSFFEDNSINFVHTPEGNYMYIEGFEPWSISGDFGAIELNRNYDLQKLTRAISALVEPDRTRAQNYLKRLEELFEEAKKGSTPR